MSLRISHSIEVKLQFIWGAAEQYYTHVFHNTEAFLI
jgi:hypothetical protein